MQGNPVLFGLDGLDVIAWVSRRRATGGFRLAS